MKRLLLLFFLISPLLSWSKGISQADVVESNFSDTTVYEREHELFFVYVTINGKQFKFLFDTGAITVLKSSTAKSVGLRANDTIEVTDGNNESKKMGIIKPLDTLKVGNTTFANNWSVVWDDSSFIFDCLGIDGILGANVINACNWQFVPGEESNKLVLTDKLNNLEHRKGARKLKIKLSDSQGTPYVKVKKPKGLFMFDTGFNGSVKLNKESLGMMDYFEMLKDSVYRVGSAYQNLFGEEYHDTSVISLMDIEFRQWFVKNEAQAITTFGTGNRPMIGTYWIGDGVFTYAPKRERIWIEGKPLNQLTTLKGVGISTRSEDEKFIVTTLIKNSPADEAGIKIGDEIVTLNTIELDHNCSNYENLQRTLENGRSVMLGIKRGTELIDVTLENTQYISP
ncbi:PDZ domain-containing protein [Salibacter halophilus]|uniref:PDZ domain-containing protein n=1 Tax=Salibacter halophilus TaxID=1803916 RepID=A0A6N6MD65_9FLAO|nr:PDZ domain-containing protein [Salibacter halophilus]KAB1065529.1 PDZ domain-containing protein [Salibacter halophilus]